MGYNILVVDDSVVARRNHRLPLTQNGYVVVEAANGLEALTIAQQLPFDLILVDLSMPIMSGAELVRKLRAMPEYAETPVYVLTTDTSRAAVAEMKEIGVNAWIIKPVRPDLLLAAVRKAERKFKKTGSFRVG